MYPLLLKLICILFYLLPSKLQKHFSIVIKDVLEKAHKTAKATKRLAMRRRAQVSSLVPLSPATEVVGLETKSSFAYHLQGAEHLRMQLSISALTLQKAEVQLPSLFLQGVIHFLDPSLCKSAG